MRRIAFLTALAVAVPTAPALAHFGPGDVPPPGSGGGGAGGAPTKPRAAGPALLPLSDTWCGTPTTVDETAGDTRLPHWKLVYAYADPDNDPTNANDGNLFAARAPIIQRNLKRVNAALNAASDGTRELRLDIEEGPCGRYVDILVVKLSKQGGTYVDRHREISDEVRPRVPRLDGVQRNVLVWADIGAFGGGTADTPEPIFADAGGAYALVYGNSVGGNTFQSSTEAFDAVAPLHEMLHNLGAVPSAAPNVTYETLASGRKSLGHCFDEWDVMCQPEGDKGPEVRCADPAGDDSLIVDCNRDDYFDHAPPPGSRLATAYNTASSPFMLAPPRAALSVSAATVARGQPVTFSAQGSRDDNLSRVRYDWDFDGNGSVDQSTQATPTATHAYPVAGTFTPRVTLVDGDGMTATATSSVTVTAPSPPPGPGPGPTPPARPATVGSLALSPASFRAATRGGSVAKAKAAPVGSTVRFRLDRASVVTFTVEQEAAGRRKGKTCVSPSRAPRGKPCTRIVPVSGSFTRAGTAGANSFKFTGRLRNRSLAVGRYRLIATPARAGGRAGTPVRARFSVVKR